MVGARNKSRILIAFAAAAMTTSGSGQLPVSQTQIARSFSGQFIVQDKRAAGPSQVALRLGTNTGLVVFEPTALAVSAERLKQSLWRELGSTADWRSRVYLSLYAAQSAEDPITITSEHFRDGWQYRLDLPDVATRNEFVRAMVQVLLLEFANRNARERSAEIPLWLAEGLTQQLFSSDEIELCLPRASDKVNGVIMASTSLNRRRKDPLEWARQQLTTHPFLTFDQLSWPREEQLSGEPGALYRLSAQVLLTELLRLKEGQARLRAMLTELPAYYNWQFAFLRAFNTSFNRLLDVEKWWTLELVRFTKLETMLSWSMKESWQRLDELIRPPVQVRASTNDMPVRTQVSLQSIIRDWEPAAQTTALKRKVQELEMIRLRLAPGLLGLADEYHAALRTYLEQRDKTSFFLPFRRAGVLRHAKEQATKQLDNLDVRRMALRPKLEPTTTAKTDL
jgi:hypothetical protein